MLERQRKLEQELRRDVGEMLWQRDRTFKLYKRVESLVEGDVCHIARPKRNEILKACNWAIVPRVVYMCSGTGFPAASVCTRVQSNREQQICLISAHLLQVRLMVWTLGSLRMSCSANARGMTPCGVIS